MKKILIVDDELEFRSLMSDYLTLRFHQSTMLIETAPDGIVALEKIRNTQFDLLITDIRMPKMNGHQLLAEIEKLPEEFKPKATVVASGHETFENQRPKKHVIFLEKPVDLPILGRFVDGILGLSNESEIGPQTVEPFIHATVEALLAKCNTNAHAVETSVRKRRNSFGNVVGVLDIAENSLAGQFSLSLDEKLCISLVHQLTGKTYEQVGDEAQTALLDIMNDIFERAQKEMGEIGVELKTTNSSVLLGRNKMVEKSDSLDLFFSSRFTTDLGNFLIELNLKKVA